MGGTAWLVLLAFLAPTPSWRPEPPPPGPQPDRIAAFLMVATVFLMVAPMVTIWSFHRPRLTFERQCAAAGGRVVYRSLTNEDPPRCAMR